MSTNHGKIHLNVPPIIYRKLQELALKERRPVCNMAIVLIEKGLEAK